MFTVQCDFDATITVHDLGVRLQKSFTTDRAEWDRTNDEYEAGLISVEECQRRQFAKVRISADEARDFAVREVEVRPGFSQAVEYCLGEGIRFVIVSNGMDIYIDAVLQKLGLSDLERYSGHGRVTGDGMSIEYADPEGNPIEENFKVACLRHLQAAEQPVVCIGDSISDIAPALGADHVIARGGLLERFRRHELPHFAFETFYEIKDHLRGLLASRAGRPLRNPGPRHSERSVAE